jgi:hypothetical protein
MNKAMPGIFVRFLLVSSLAVSAALLYFYLFQFLPSQAKLLESRLISRARAVSELSSRTLVRAIETRDDLALVSALEDIRKLDEVSSVYILDPGGKVLTHDSVSEWNKTYSDGISKKALASKGMLVQRTPSPKGYLFSTPLTSGAVLCLALSSRKMDESLALARRKALYSGLTAFFVVMLVLGGFVYYAVGPRLGKLKEMLKNLAPGSGALPVDARDELGELTGLINEAIRKIEKGGDAGVKRADETVQKLEGLIRTLTDNMDGGIMVLDGENRIIGVNDAFRNSLLPDASPVGRHFLEAVRSARLIELVKRASLDPGNPVEEIIEGSAVRVIAVAGQAGIVVMRSPGKAGPQGQGR